jgi:hypothetical protein
MAKEPQIVAGVAEATDFPIKGEGSECVAQLIVDVVGVEELEAVGFPITNVGRPEIADVEMDQAAAEEIVDGFDGCGLDPAGALYDVLFATGSWREETKACVRDAVTPEVARQFFVDMFTGADAGPVPAVVSCLS